MYKCLLNYGVLKKHISCKTIDTLSLHSVLNKNEMIQVDKAEEAKDNRKSGKHIITMVKHRFHLPKMQYTQMIEINRDTMERDHADEN